MTDESIVRDERTVSVENASFRWAYLLLSYGLLVSVAYRGLVRHENSWDLLALVMAGGAVSSLHQGSQGVLSRRWVMLSTAAAVLALVLGGVIALLRR